MSLVFFVHKICVVFFFNGFGLTDQTSTEVLDTNTENSHWTNLGYYVFLPSTRGQDWIEGPEPPRGDSAYERGGAMGMLVV